MCFSTCCRLIAGVTFLVQITLVHAQNHPKHTRQDTLKLIADDERQRLIDPALKRVPYERLQEARRQLANTKSARARTGIPNLTWQERGPSNLGSRTRTLLFDPNDPTHKKVWAGSLSGGLWFTNDITDPVATWTAVSDSWENKVVTALAADPSNPQVMYAGTGDTYDYQAGGGIWKTTNGGTDWTRLPGTIPGGTVPAVSQAFTYIQRIVVNSAGTVFVATRFGVVKSANGGSTWSYALAPGQLIGVGGIAANYFNDNVTDLEIGTDGILYAGFNPSRVFKSNDATGNAWTEITPQGASGGERTELTLASSTSGAGQVIYGASRAYNSITYGQDLRWFKKSTNGGATWTDMAIPTYSSTRFFTDGNGYYSLALAAHPTDPNTLYAGGTDWYRSTDGGATWSSTLLGEYSPNQHFLQFQPGGAGAVFSGNQGVNWSANWSQPTPTVINRNTGYRTGEFYSVAMKATPGNAYLIGGTRASGTVKITSPNLSAGSVVVNSSFDMGIALIDEDEPSIQVLSSYYGSYYLYNGTTWTYLTATSATSNNPTEYDSQSNTLYAYDYANNSYTIRKITGIGGTTSSTNLSLAGMAATPSFFKLSPDKQSIFVGTYNGQLYKVTNLNQPTPTVTSISNNTYLQNATVSSIDVGSNDNELLVTYSNFGVKSVWYTSNGGANWTSKDELGYGLPDIPVRYALFNPQNRQHVLLATELGIWSTTDVTATNPGWQSSSDGLGGYRVNMLRYRASDGRLAAATFGRGLFTSDAFALAYTLPSVAITTISNTTLCAGNTFTVAVSTAGPAFGTGNKFEVWLSDGNGNFANSLKIGSNTGSPISAALPGSFNALPYGTNYRLKVIATNPEVESSISDALAIGNLGNVNVHDRRTEVAQSYTSGLICSGSQATLKAYAYATNYAAATPDSYQWLFNGSAIGGATSATLSAQQAGVYTAMVKQAGCTVTSSTYTLNTSANPYSSILSASYGEPQCDDHPLKLISSSLGQTATYQWTRDGIDIAGATSYSYTATQTGSYSYRVIDGSCASTAPSSYFQFGRALLSEIHIGQDYDSLLCSSSYDYTALRTNTPISNDYTIQWYRDGSIITGATSTYYYPSQSGLYSILLKQGSCQTYSNALTVKKSDEFKARIYMLYGSNKSPCPGEARNLYASPSIYANFQWERDGIAIPGATSSSYTATLSGNYTVRITKGNCAAISDPLLLTFSNTIQPKIQLSENCVGVSLSTNNSGNEYTIGGYQYQWYQNGMPISAATQSTHYATQSGVYSLQVTNGNCTGLSKEVYAYVGLGVTAKPGISVNSLSRHLCANNSFLLTATSYRGNLQWKRNGIAIPGATRYQLYATQSGLYSAVAQDGSCTAESDPIDVKIGEATTATLSGNALISNGQSTLLPVKLTGPAPWSFSLTNGQSVTATYQNPSFVAVSPASTTTYQLASVVNACGLGTTSGQASVSVGTGSADVSLNMVVSNRAPNVGDVVKYTLTAANTGPDDAQNVQIKSLLPTGLTFAGTTSPGVSVANGVVTANMGTVPANGLSAISFHATPTQPGTFATAAQITSSQTPDPDSQPNSGTGDGQDDEATIDIRTTNGGLLVESANPDQVPLPVVSGNQPTPDPATADLSLALRTDKVAPVVSEIVTTTLTVSNRGGSTASSVVIQVVLPNGTFSSQSPAGWIQVNSQTYKRYVNLLPAGQSTMVSLKWQPSGSGTLKAQILDMGETDPDSTPGNGYANGEDDEAAVSVRIR